MAIDRILEKSNDSAAATPSGQNDAASVQTVSKKDLGFPL